MSFPYINSYQQFFDSSGDPLVGGTIEFRSPTTNSLINTYPTADDADAQTNANANPLTLSATGAASAGLFLEDGVAYKVILKDAAGNTVATHDDVRCPIALPYLTTAAETAAGVTPTNVEYPPGNVLRYGATGDGTTDDTTAIQSALDIASNTSGGTAYKTSRFKVTFPWGTYKITRPLELSGDNLIIDGCGSTIIKSTNDIPTTTHAVIAVSGGNVDPNVNAIFLTKTKIRFSVIENFNLEGVSGTSTPEGIWLVGNENTFRSIFMREVSIGFHAVSAWMTHLEQVVIRESTGISFYWDATRVSGTGQSGTSIHFSNCFAVAPATNGFYLWDCDYVKFSACACDGAGAEAYYIRGCSGVSGNIAWEDRNVAATTAAIQFASGSSGSLVIDSFDDTNRAVAAIKLSDSVITLSGRLRTDEDDFFDLSTNSRLYADGLHIDPLVGSVTVSRFTVEAGSSYSYEPLQAPVATAFTPSITIGGVNTGITYTAANGNYIEISSRVWFDMIISLSSKGGLTGAVVITDLPVAVANTLASTTIEASAVVSQWSGMTTSVYDIKASVKSDDTILLYPITAAATSMTSLDGTDLSDTTTLYLSGSYAV